MIEKFWSSFFGITPHIFRGPGRVVVSHCGLSGFHGAWIFRTPLSTIISVPGGIVEEVRARLSRVTHEEDEGLVGSFAPYDPVVASRWVHLYLLAETFRPSHASEARRLTLHDRPAVLDLASACPESDWEDIRVDLNDPNRFGCFHEGVLVAVSGMTMLDHSTVRISTMVRPSARGMGFGKAATSAAAAFALDEGYLVLWQTLLSNAASIGTAVELGFRHFATHSCIRLRSAGRHESVV